MAHALNNFYVPFNLMARIRGFVETIKSNRARRAAFNTAYAELQMLSDHELVEFGLHRSDLVNLARAEAVRR